MKIAKTKLFTYIQPLLQSGCNPDRVAEFNFRSIGEVRAYINGIRPTLLATVRETEQAALVPPSLPKRYGTQVPHITQPIKVPVDLLQTLQTQLETLRTLDALLDNSFHREALGVRDELHALQMKVETSIQSLMKQLGSMSKKVRPQFFSQLCAELMRSLRAGLDGCFRGIFDYHAVTQQESGTLFSYYVEFIDLTNEAQGYTYPQFYVILSGLQRGNRMELFLNTVHQFYVPGAYPLGTQVFDAPTMLDVAAKLLADDNFQDAVAAPIPGNVRFTPLMMKDHGILSVSLDRSRRVLGILFKKGIIPDEHGNMLARRIQNVIGQGGIRWETVGPSQINMHLVVPKEPGGLNAEQREWLSTVLHASPEVIQQIETLVHKG